MRGLGDLPERALLLAPRLGARIGRQLRWSRWRCALLLGGALGDPRLELGDGAGDRLLDQLPVQRRGRRSAAQPRSNSITTPAARAWSTSPRRSGRRRRRRSGQAGGQLDRALIQRLGLLAEPQRGDVVAVDAAEVRGEHLAVGLAQRGVQHPPRLAGQPLGGPLVAVGQIRDQRVQQRR